MDDLIISKIREYVVPDDEIYFDRVCIQWNKTCTSPRNTRFCKSHRSISQFKEFYDYTKKDEIKIQVIYKFLTFGKFNILSLPEVKKIISEKINLKKNEDHHCNIMYTVLQQGDISVLFELIILGCKLPKDSVRYGCYSGNIEILIFLEYSGFKLNNKCYIYCMDKGHDEMIMYFMGGFLPWNHWEISSKAIEHQFMLSIAKNGTVDTMKKSIEYGLICTTGYSIEKAVLFNRLPMVKTLLENGVHYVEYNNECEMLVLATRNCDLEMVKYLHFQGFMIGPNVREEALIQEKMDIVEYVDNYI